MPYANTCFRRSAATLWINVPFANTKFNTYYSISLNRWQHMSISVVENYLHAVRQKKHCIFRVPSWPYTRVVFQISEAVIMGKAIIYNHVWVNVQECQAAVCTCIVLLGLKKLIIFHLDFMWLFEKNVETVMIHCHFRLTEITIQLWPS